MQGVPRRDQVNLELRGHPVTAWRYDVTIHT
jgi:hypothetical protein